MFAIVVAMIIVIGLTVVVFGLAAVGAQGRWRGRVPRLAAWLARVADQLNGDSDKRLVG